LIPNGSFEDISKCPVGCSAFQNAIGWVTPTGGTTDLFCKCKKGDTYVGVPLNLMGYQKPKTGKCYAGLIAYSSALKNYSEYMLTRLTGTLIKDKKYCIKLYYSFANNSLFFLNRLGIHFSNDTKNLLLPKKTNKLKVAPVIYFGVNTDTLNWVCQAMDYTANGTENFITIGAFDFDSLNRVSYHPRTPNKYRRFTTNLHAYYYIDDINLTELEEGKKCLCEGTDTMQTSISSPLTVPSIFDRAINAPLALQNINFELNKSLLLSNSFEELNNLVDYLKEHSNYNIELSGHTDSTGKEENNIKLSEERAKAVADYLIQHGIGQSRINYKGYGSSKPIADNKIEKGKAANRRVEISFKK
jgi:outer membrane protein OmpA-like peptidoglycan-associated protein